MKVELVSDSLMKANIVMKVGDIGVTESGKYLLRIFGGFTNLNNPHETWYDDCPITVKVLPKGTVIKLTIE